MQKKQAVSRLRRIEGQIRGISKLITNNSPQLTVIQQIEAVKGALSSLEKAILEESITARGT